MVQMMSLTNTSNPNYSSTQAFSIDTIPGALDPVGLFDPLGLAAKADQNTLKRYREAELTHGRVSMLAVIGFLVGEKVEGSSFLFDASVKGPAITHLAQVSCSFLGRPSLGHCQDRDRPCPIWLGATA
jgi:hypothetical protein